MFDCLLPCLPRARERRLQHQEAAERLQKREADLYSISARYSHGQMVVTDTPCVGASQPVIIPTGRQVDAAITCSDAEAKNPSTSMHLVVGNLHIPERRAPPHLGADPVRTPDSLPCDECGERDEGVEGRWCASSDCAPCHVCEACWRRHLLQVHGSWTW